MRESQKIFQIKHSSGHLTSVSLIVSELKESPFKLQGCVLKAGYKQSKKVNEPDPVSMA